MKTLKTMAAIICTSTIALSFSAMAVGESSSDLQQAHSLVKQFGKSLKGTLKASLKADGPEAAIGVCNLQALPIATGISAQSDWTVARTSLKPRNAENTPDKWELNVLNQFEQRKAAGEDPKKIEYFEIIENGSQSEYRYMKAIPTGEVCLKCHGTNLTDSITKKINSLYPDDKATGFKLGDIRGAFSFKKVKG